MMQDNNVSDYFLDVETHAQFMLSISSGNPNYNLLSQK